MIERRKKRENLLRVCLCALILIFAIHIGSSIFRRAEIDLTADKIYSLSEGTEEILHKLSAPLSLKLYYSKTAANKGSEGIRTFNIYFQYVRDLLEEYVSESRGQLKLQVIDPRPDTEEEAQAQAYGLKKFNLSETETYFFGLVIENQNGGEKVIEFFDPSDQSKLEYQISKLIVSIQQAASKRIGILASLPVLNDESSPYMAQLMRMQGKQAPESWIITKLMQETYSLKKIESETEVIDSIDSLVLIQPGILPEQTLFAIDQFLLKGGKILALLDPLLLVQQNQNPLGGQGAPKTHNLGPLLGQWGISAPSETLVGDTTLSEKRSMAPGMPPQKIIQLLSCGEKCRSKEQSVVTSNLNNLLFMAPGLLKLKEKDGLKGSILLQTTEQGNTYQKSQAMGPPQMLAESFKLGDAAQAFGVQTKGLFQSAYPDGVSYEVSQQSDQKKGPQKSATKKMQGIQVSEKEGAVIVIADVDFIADQVAFRQSMFGVSLNNDNSGLFMNALDQLSGSTELMSIRSKGNFGRPFRIIDQIESESQEKTAAQVAKINQNLSRFQNELQAIGRSSEQGASVAVIKNEAIKRKKSLSGKIAELKRELRNVKRDGREKVETLGMTLQYLNTLLVPGILLILGLELFRRRRKKMTSYQFKEQQV